MFCFSQFVPNSDLEHWTLSLLWCLAGNTLVWLLLNLSTHYCIIIHAPHFSHFNINLFPLCLIATSGLLLALSIQCAVDIDMEMSCLGLLPTKFGTAWHSEFHHQWIPWLWMCCFQSLLQSWCRYLPSPKDQKTQKARQSFGRSQVYWLGIGPV